MGERILIVAAHPDDEILGVGGTIARRTREGAEVRIMFLTNGVGSRAGTTAADVEARRSAAREACATVGATIVHFGDFPDNAMDSIPLLEVARFVEAVKRDWDPTTVYTHHGGDLNIDHRIACQAVLTAFRPQPSESLRELLAFSVDSSTEWSHPCVGLPFVPDTFVDISDDLDTLLRAYTHYDAESRPDPHARSVEALRVKALRRGRAVGRHAVEAFVTLRRVH